MSRIGKLPIPISQDVKVKIEDRTIIVNGPKGELSFNFGYKVDVKIDQEQNQITVEQKENTKQGKAMWGTARASINNLVVGVVKGFEKKLELHGVGYKMAVQGNKLNLNLGYSHPINKDIPQELEVSIDKETLIIKGADKQLVGEFAAETRSLRKVEPYKGKGFRYSDEQVVRKEGKRAGGTE